MILHLELIALDALAFEAILFVARLAPAGGGLEEMNRMMRASEDVRVHNRYSEVSARSECFR